MIQHFKTYIKIYLPSFTQSCVSSVYQALLGALTNDKQQKCSLLFSPGSLLPWFNHIRRSVIRHDMTAINDRFSFPPWIP
mmetsp:Transcript_15765/g.37887  ORF Transcript_15765/g.37887 Transcript_15765/m.37887 type:complete len:80 (-) Transcript_15765:121-360(-)